jgi:hypothetical protein
MTEETARVVREIRGRCRGVTSLVGRYESAFRLQLMPFEARGRFYFQSPDKYRSESVRNSSEIISVRNGSRVERRLPARKEVWKYDLKDFPQTLPLNYGIADHRDPFFSVDEGGLIYEGLGELENMPVQRFSADIRALAQQGVLDTRKGFSIRYQPKTLRVRMQLSIASETGLLRRMIGNDTTGKPVLQVDYIVEGINVALDGSLFALEETSAAYKSIDITDVMLSAMNPDAADAPPSAN